MCDVSKFLKSTNCQGASEDGPKSCRQLYCRIDVQIALAWNFTWNPENFPKFIIVQRETNGIAVLATSTYTGMSLFSGSSFHPRALSLSQWKRVQSRQSHPNRSPSRRRPGPTGQARLVIRLLSNQDNKRIIWRIPTLELPQNMENAIKMYDLGVRPQKTSMF